MKFFFLNKTKADITQTGVLAYIERLSRSHPYIYMFARKVAFYFNIFEKEFDGVKKIKFSNNKINLLYIGASDGIAIKYINKFKTLNNIYAFEPNIFYFKKLLKLKKNFKKLKSYNFGLSDRTRSHLVFIPFFEFFGRRYYMFTYTFYNLIELKENLRINFVFKKNMKIKKKRLKLKTMPSINNKIDLVKIDVNGHELNVIMSLKKLILKDSPAFILEDFENIDKIKNFMKKYNYGCYYYSVELNKLLKYRNKKNKNLNFYFLKKNHLKKI
jgi:FkbM family methyltransferase